MPFNYDNHHNILSHGNRERSDVILFVIVFLTVALAVALFIVSTLALSVVSMWVTIPSMIAGLAAAGGVAFWLRKIRMKREAKWQREKAEVAEAETRRKLDEMYQKASNVPKVKK